MYDGMTPEEIYREARREKGIGPVRAFRRAYDSISNEHELAILDVLRSDMQFSDLLSLRVAHEVVATNGDKRSNVRTDFQGNTMDTLFNPWQFVVKINGWSIIKADQTARYLGIPETSPERIKAVMVDQLGKMLDMSGDTYADFSQYGFRRSVAQVMKEIKPNDPSHEFILEFNRVGIELTKEGIFTKPFSGRHVNFNARTNNYYLAPKGKGCITLVETENDEKFIAENLLNREGIAQGKLTEIPDDKIAGMASVKTGFMLDPAQIQAVRNAFDSPTSVITGGPGSGKTACIRSIVEIANLAGINQVILCAFTGKAAQRITEETGYPASTIFQAFRFLPNGDDMPDVPILESTGIVVIDECSMLSVPILAQTLKRIPVGWNVVMVGDVRQLPPIGRGDPYRDIIETGKFPVSELTANHRTESADLGDVITAIHDGIAPKTSENYRIIPTSKVVNGKLEILTPYENSQNAILFMRKNLGAILREMADRVKCEMEDIAVIIPHSSHQNDPERIRLTTQEMNLILKLGVFNPSGGADIEAGDKVICKKNHKDDSKTVVIPNGMTGFVVARTTKTLTVKWDGDIEMEYVDDDIKEFVELGYAITVHKAQGSQAPAVLFIADGNSSQNLMTNRLVYTAISRAQKLVCVLVIPPYNLPDAIKRADVNNRMPVNGEILGRQTRLPKFIESIANGETP